MNVNPVTETAQGCALILLVAILVHVHWATYGLLKTAHVLVRRHIMFAFFHGNRYWHIFIDANECTFHMYGGPGGRALDLRSLSDYCARSAQDTNSVPPKAMTQLAFLL